MVVALVYVWGGGQVKGGGLTLALFLGREQRIGHVRSFPWTVITNTFYHQNLFSLLVELNIKRSNVKVISYHVL